MTNARYCAQDCYKSLVFLQVRLLQWLNVESILFSNSFELRDWCQLRDAKRAPRSCSLLNLLHASPTAVKPFSRSSQTSSTMLVPRRFLQASIVLLFLCFNSSRSSALFLAVSPPSFLLSGCQLSVKIATKGREVRCACRAVQRLAKICIDLANDSGKTALQQTALCSSRIHSYGRYTNTISNFDNPRWKYSASLVKFHRRWSKENGTIRKHSDGTWSHTMPLAAPSRQMKIIET